jgi:hypothetical protein
MACLELSPDGTFCKTRSGVLYLDDFTSALAGRYTILEDGTSGEGWQIVNAVSEVVSGVWSDWYETVYGTQALRVRHNVADSGLRLRIQNDEFPDPYVLDSLGRDYPWFSARMGARAVSPLPVPGYPDGFPYDWAWGGFEHKIQATPANAINTYHTHQCGFFTTWVFMWYYVDGLWVTQSQLINLPWNFWYMKHHFTPDEQYFTQGQPGGWSVGSDGWFCPPEFAAYSDVQGKFGFNSAQCGSGFGSTAADSYLYYHGLVVCETNYITIIHIPPDPRGADAVPGFSEGNWMFKMVHPEIGIVNQTPVFPGGLEEIAISFSDHNFAWEAIEVWIYPDAGTAPELFTSFAPADYVNGGDIYCFDENGTADVTCAVTEPPIVLPPGVVICQCEGGIHVEGSECQAGIVVEC